MTKDEIVSLLKNHHQTKAEMDILKRCSHVDSAVQTKHNERYLFLKKRISLINNWFLLLPKKEAVVLRLHLLEGIAWGDLCTIIKQPERQGRPYDPRTLQRAQKRALEKIKGFMDTAFGDSLDYLISDKKTL